MASRLTENGAHMAHCARMLDDLTFLRVINASPDDDGPRLLYADYLDEKGDPASAAQAEFVRVQCALNAAGPGTGDITSLRQRERALLTEHWRTWLRPACQALAEPLPNPSRPSAQGSRYELKWISGEERDIHYVEQSGTGELPYFRSAQFRRGFLAHAALAYKASRGERHVALLWDRAPIDGLTLFGFAPHHLATTLAAIEGGERIRSLELGFSDDGSVTLIAMTAGLGAMRELVLKGIQGRSDVAHVLARSTTLEALQILILDTCTVDEEGIARLCRAPFARALVRLELINCGVTNSAAIRLTREFPTDGRLKHVDLTGNPLSAAATQALQHRFGAVLYSHFGKREWPTRYFL